MTSAGQPAVILDRDGTLSQEQGFVTDAEQLRIFPQSLQALRRLDAAGYLLVVVTNQSGIARGLYGETDLSRVHERMHSALDGLPRAYLHCPHHPDAEHRGSPYGRDCDCRKPGGGMLDQADRLFPGIDWSRSFLVGDAARDLLMGRSRAAKRILVQTGKPWQEQIDRLESEGCPPHFVATDLSAATDWILSAG